VVWEGGLKDFDEGFGRIIGKTGSEGVKIKFEARQKRQELD